MQGGPRMFSQSSTTSDLLDRRRSPVAYRTVTFCGRPFQSVRLGSQRRTARSRGLVRVRSPLLTESRLISFPPGTEMFQFPGFAPNGLCIQPPVLPSGCPVTMGCPIRRSPDQSLFGGSPELIAAYNVLHRLCTPRHPPYTLTSLTTFVNGCGQHRTSLQSERTESGTAAAGPHGAADDRPTPQARQIPVRPPLNLSQNPPSADSRRRPAPARAGLRAPDRCPEAHAPDTRPLTGADRDRTGSLRVANAALSRLSYGPATTPARTRLATPTGTSAPAASPQSPRE